MVFGPNALAPGPGKASNSIYLPPAWRKVKGGKITFHLVLAGKIGVKSIYIQFGVI
jgi:hypothetical protein